MKSKHSSPERRKSSRSTRSRSTRSRSIRSKSIRSRTRRSLKEKKSRTLSLRKSKSPVEEWKKPYTYEKVTRGKKTDITYCIPVTKSRELGIGSINMANYKAIIDKKTNNKQLEGYIDRIIDRINDESSKIRDIVLIMFTYPYFSDEVLLHLFNTHTELLKVILENEDSLHKDVYTAFLKFSKKTSSKSSKSLKSSQQGGWLGDMLREKLARAAAVIGHLREHVNLKRFMDMMDALSDDMEANIQIRERGEQRGRVEAQPSLDSFEIIGQDELAESLEADVVVLPPQVIHQFSADTRRGFMISEMIGGIRTFLKIGPINKEQDISIQTAKNPLKIPNMMKIGSYLYEARIYEILNRRAEESGHDATLGDISNYVPKLYDYGINNIKNKGTNQKTDFKVKINTGDGVLEYDLGGFVTDALLNIKWPYRMAIDQPGRRKFCYFVTESKAGFLPYSQAVETSRLPTQFLIKKFLRKAFNVLTYFYHNYGFVHWDLHSENILCNAAGDVMLYDFDWSTVMWSRAAGAGDAGVKYTLSTFFDPRYQLVYASRFINEHLLANPPKPHPHTVGIHQNQVLVHKVGHMYDLYRLFYNNKSVAHLAAPNPGQRININNLVILINSILKRYYAPLPTVQFQKILNAQVLATGTYSGILGGLMTDLIHKSQEAFGWTDTSSALHQMLTSISFLGMFLHSYIIFKDYMDYFTPTYL